MADESVDQMSNDQIMTRVRSEFAFMGATELMERMVDTCFKKCISKYVNLLIWNRLREIVAMSCL